MKTTNTAPHDSVTTHPHDGAIFISLEMGRANWLVTALLPGSEKMSRHEVPGGDAAELFALTARLKGKVAKRTGPDIPVIAIQEAGTDGFWLHRMMLKEGIESYVVDATSIAVARKFRRTKTDAVARTSQPGSRTHPSLQPDQGLSHRAWYPRLQPASSRSL